MPLTSAAKTFSIRVIGDGEATGIEDIHVICDEDESGKQGIFDQQGRQLNAEPTNGIYIKNGKKFENKMQDSLHQLPHGITAQVQT